MDILGLVLAILKLVNYLMNFVNREQLMQAGRQEEIAKESLAIAKRTFYGKAMLEKASALSEGDVDTELGKLE